MTLKTRLVTTISMFFLVVALLITGVWAVSSANVNIGGTISFNATNIYATITGSISGATTTPTLSPLNYSAKSTPSTTEINTWKQNLTFADATIPTIKWTVTIQNKSERALYVTLTDNISSLTNATKTLTFDNGSANGEQTIPAKTTKVYTMEIKVTDTNASASVEYNFIFDLRDATAPEPLLKRDSKGFYVEMGTYQSNPVKWRLVGVKESGASETTKFTGSTAPSAGSVGTFILETNTGITQSFNASEGNNYATSDIRTYLNGDYITALNLANDATYNAITAREITDLHTDIGWAYSSDGTTVPNEGGDDAYAPPTGTKPNATYNTSVEGATGADKLWLMSVKEIYTLVGGGALGANGTIPYDWSAYYDNLIWRRNSTDEYGVYYWLRSPYPGNSFYAFSVRNNGAWGGHGVALTRAVRPAFNLEF
ncbi:MAG: hypothetical protein J6C53_00935 [Clostridia bacterium]|nr:hypothetical protein [Clostridia bacterium]